MDPRNLDPGSVIADRWRVRRLLGRGAHGAVYEVEHTLTGHLRALKVLTRASTDGRATRRFLVEARALARLNHPHVVRVDDFGEDHAGLLYLLMERLQGETLRSILDRWTALEPGVALIIVRDMLAALQAAHALGIVHRDLKPENVFVHRGEGGRAIVKLCDFGVAKLPDAALTHDGAHAIGTPAYMSPEQQDASSTVDGRADLYGLGVVLFEAIAGRRPFVSDSAAEVAALHRHLPAPRLAAQAPRPISPALDAAVAHALAKRPDDRPASCADLRVELAAAPEWSTADLPLELLATMVDPAVTRSLDDASLGVPTGGERTVASVSQSRAEADPGRPEPSGRRRWATALGSVVLVAAGVAVWTALDRRGGEIPRVGASDEATGRDTRAQAGPAQQPDRGPSSSALPALVSAPPAATASTSAAPVTPAPGASAASGSPHRARPSAVDVPPYRRAR